MFENLILCDNQQQRPPKGRNVQRLKVLYLMNYIVYKTTNLINGKIYVGNLTSEKHVRPVIYLKPDIEIKKGSGSADDPWVGEE